MVIAAEYPFLSIVGTMVVFFGFVIWFWLLIRVFGDVFRRRDIGGWAKFFWSVFVIVIPLLGVLIYLIAEGEKIGERDMEAANAQKAEFDAHVRRDGRQRRAWQRDCAGEATARQRRDQPGRVRPHQAAGPGIAPHGRSRGRLSSVKSSRGMPEQPDTPSPNIAPLPDIDVVVPTGAARFSRTSPP